MIENISPEIIEPSIYEETTSLKETIELLSDPTKKIKDDTIINLIIKYFYAYKYPESIDQNIDLRDIQELFGYGQSYYSIEDFDYIEILLLEKSNHFRNMLSYFSYNSYALSMLGDIACTTAIFKDIISTTIDSKNFDKKYTGLDLGTGSGILLLAQHIQAMRNRFQQIKNIGFDISKKSLKNTKVLAKALNFGTVKHGDTTKEETYNKLPDGNITYVSNETIPDPVTHMGTKQDPFHRNNKALFGAMENQMEGTSFFPSNIKMLLRKKDGNIFLNGTKENKFSLDYLIKKSFDTYQDTTKIFSDVYPEGIQLYDIPKIQQLTHIGGDLLKSGKVKPLYRWRNRWVSGWY